MNSKQTDALERVMDLVRFLRTHCPWDAAQTHRSLIPYLLEEAHEAADAIADGDDHALRAELGDLLLNVAFQLVLAQERQAFEASDVADTVIDKMQRRHPDLYGLGDAEEWETMKAKERHTGHSTLHGVARGLDPLSKAHRIQDRVAAIGFDWADAGGAFGKVVEELEEVRRELYGSAARQQHDGRQHDGQQHNSTTAQQHNSTTAEQHNSTTAERTTAQQHNSTSGQQPSGPVREQQGGTSALEEELGDLLFAVVNLSRLAGVHSLTALHAANAKFTRRFHALERLAAARGVDLETAGLERLDALWEEIKAGERAKSE